MTSHDDVESVQNYDESKKDVSQGSKKDVSQGSKKYREKRKFILKYFLIDVDEVSGDERQYLMVSLFNTLQKELAEGNIVTEIWFKGILIFESKYFNTQELIRDMWTIHPGVPIELQHDGPPKKKVIGDETKNIMMKKFYLKRYFLSAFFGVHLIELDTIELGMFRREILPFMRVELLQANRIETLKVTYKKKIVFSHQELQNEEQLKKDIRDVQDRAKREREGVILYTLEKIWEFLKYLEAWGWFGLSFLPGITYQPPPSFPTTSVTTPPENSPILSSVENLGVYTKETLIHGKNVTLSMSSYFYTWGRQKAKQMLSTVANNTEKGIDSFDKGLDAFADGIASLFQTIPWVTQNFVYVVQLLIILIILVVVYKVVHFF